MDIARILDGLCSASGISGSEAAAHGAVLKLLNKYTPGAEVDSFGNITAHIEGIASNKHKPAILLEAHLDRIGMIVTHIDEHGFLKVGGVGGIDRRALIAQPVTVFGKGTHKGVISSLPPHVERDNKKSPKLEEISIDVGLTKEQAQKSIPLGSPVVINGMFSCLAGSRICSPGTDNRAGIAAIIYALELLRKEKELPFEITVLFASQEEVGCRGAAIAAYNIAPDYAIAVDVTFALSHGVSPYESGAVSKGAMIGISPVLNRELSQKLVDTAKEKKIPYQIEVMPKTTGTDADEISISAKGVITGLISIPQRYMHTPCEVIDTEDVKAAGKLIAEFIKGGI